MISFQDFLKESDIFDLRTEIDLTAQRIRRANMIVGNARNAELNDINDSILNLKSVAQEFLNTLDDLTTGRSVHV